MKIQDLVMPVNLAAIFRTGNVKVAIANKEVRCAANIPYLAAQVQILNVFLLKLAIVVIAVTPQQQPRLVECLLKTVVPQNQNVSLPTMDQ